MPVYAYKGVDAAGKSLRGHLDAETPRSARSRLKRDGIFVTEFQETSADAVQRESGGSRFNFNVNVGYSRNHVRMPLSNNSSNSILRRSLRVAMGRAVGP